MISLWFQFRDFVYFGGNFVSNESDVMKDLNKT